MTLQEYNDLYKNPLVKSMNITSSGGVTITNTNIVSEQMSLDSSLCSEENLRYGRCEAKCFKIRIADMNHNFKGEWLNVVQNVVTDSNGYLLLQDGSYLLTQDGKRLKLTNEQIQELSVTLGSFKVYSDKPVNDRRWRDLVCYDAMYDILNADVNSWYNSLTFPMTLKSLRDSFFTHLGITQVTTTLVNDNFQTQGGFEAEGELSGKTIIEAICELNGVFGQITSDGKFDYLALKDAETLTLDYYVDGTGSYEEYTTNKVTGIIAVSSQNDTGTVVGTATNQYVIDNNPLIYGAEGTVALQTALLNILNVIKDDTFRPFEVTTYGNPMLPLGTKITLNTRNQTVVANIIHKSLTGVQDLKDVIGASGDESQPEMTNSVAREVKRTKGMMVLKVDSSGKMVTVALGASATEGSHFQVAADDILLNASHKLELVTNTFTIDSTYLKVDSTGRITATSGEIGGWDISDTSIFKNNSTFNSVLVPGHLVVGDTSSGNNSQLYTDHVSQVSYYYDSTLGEDVGVSSKFGYLGISSLHHGPAYGLEISATGHSGGGLHYISDFTINQYGEVNSDTPFIRTKSITHTRSVASGSYTDNISSSELAISGYKCIGVLQYASAIGFYISSMLVDSTNNTASIVWMNTTSLTIPAPLRYTFLYVQTGIVDMIT